jgi:thiosulfate/3-mercaptopyruvate sulfurtransferase
MTFGPLIAPDQLVSRLDDPALRAIDIRSADAYRAGHVPGAVHSDYTKDGWRFSKGMAQGLLPPSEQLAALFSRLGIEPETHVVIVAASASAGDFAMAARAYWTLRAAGHRHIALLDGGMLAWVAARRPVETTPRVVLPAPSYPVAFDGAVRSDLHAVERAVKDHAAVLVDSRARSYFEGGAKSASVARAGRLPHARHLDHAALFAGTPPRLKSKDELQALFASLPQAPVISYCNTGQQAAANWFVLSELLGRHDATLYDGSMSEWAEDPARPVETDSAS